MARETAFHLFMARLEREISGAVAATVAAVSNSSLSHYVGEVAAAHVKRQQNNQSASVDDEALQQFDERLAGFEVRRQREMELIVKRLERHFTVLKAMVDSLADNLIPERRDEYIKTVEKLVRAASQNGGGRS